MTDAQVLIVDDEPGIRTTLSRTLELEGYGVRTADTFASAQRAIGRRSPDLVLLDVKLPDGNGLDLLAELGGEEGLPFPVIVISGNSSVDDAVRALQLGAETYLEKPPESERLLKSIDNALARVRLETEIAELREGSAAKGQELLGASKAMAALRQQIERVAGSEGRALITGENGTGKELVAAAIHAGSRRRDRPFVSINCAAVPEDLIESELFGHEKGAFTGAHATKIGKIERAHEGTLFLDEVGDMPPSMQVKLLRVLQNAELERLGGSQRVEVDVRVLAATNKDLETEIAEGRFREDLYYRLNVVPLVTPPLRARKEDIPLLAASFLEDAARRNYRKRPPELSAAACQRLAAHDFPGNVRELRNLMERIVILADPDLPVLEAADIEPYIPGGAKESRTAWRAGTKLSELVHEAERAIVSEALAAHDHVVADTARALGVERSNFHKKLKALGLR